MTHSVGRPSTGRPIRFCAPARRSHDGRSSLPQAGIWPETARSATAWPNRVSGRTDRAEHPGEAAVAPLAPRSCDGRTAPQSRAAASWGPQAGKADGRRTCDPSTAQSPAPTIFALPSLVRVHRIGRSREGQRTPLRRAAARPRHIDTGGDTGGVRRHVPAAEAPALTPDFGPRLAPGPAPALAPGSAPARAPAGLAGAEGAPGCFPD